MGGFRQQVHILHPPYPPSSNATLFLPCSTSITLPTPRSVPSSNATPFLPCSTSTTLPTPRSVPRSVPRSAPRSMPRSVPEDGRVVRKCSVVEAAGYGQSSVLVHTLEQLQGAHHLAANEEQAQGAAANVQPTRGRYRGNPSAPSCWLPASGYPPYLQQQLPPVQHAAKVVEGCGWPRGAQLLQLHHCSHNREERGRGGRGRG